MKLKSVTDWARNNILYFAWGQALAATLGSLYASEILHWVPCPLCWYQRILMFPLVIILAVGILKKDKNLPAFVLPFTALGMAVAFYQYLLQLGVISENLAPCATGVSCTTKYVDFFGFVSFALLSFLAFAFISACMAVFQRSQSKK